MPPQRAWIFWDPESFIRATLWHWLRPGGRLTGGGVYYPGTFKRVRRRGLGSGILRVVLVVGDDRGHRAQPVHGGGAGPEPLRDAAGQVEDGRRDVVGTRAAVQVDRDRLAQLLLRLVRADRRRLAGPGALVTGAR